MELKAKQHLFNKYKYLLGKHLDDIDERHLVNKDPELGLRCFNYRRVKGEDHDRKLRCPDGARPGSIFCKHHDYDRAIVVPKPQIPQVYKNELNALMQRYLNEPTILDHKQDLAILRTLLTGLMNKLTQPNPLNSASLLARLQLIMQSDENDFIKYEKVMDTYYRHEDIFDDKRIRTINDTVKNIGTCIERINKVSTGDDFLMTPEGLNVFLRTVVEILRTNITDKDMLLQVQTDLMTVSVATRGNLQKVNDQFLRERKNENSRNHPSTDE